MINQLATQSKILNKSFNLVSLLLTLSMAIELTRGCMTFQLIILFLKCITLEHFLYCSLPQQYFVFLENFLDFFVVFCLVVSHFSCIVLGIHLEWRFDFVVLE